MEAKSGFEADSFQPANSTVNEKGDDAPLKPTQSDHDVLRVTQKRPYGEINSIGTYVAVCLGALSCYGGFIMPATSLALINEDIGNLVHPR